MKDIANAIIAEQQYIQDRIYNHMDVNIYSYLEPYGYTVLDEYFKDKHYYQLAHCGVTITKCETSTCISELYASVENEQRPGIWIPTPASGKPFAWHFNLVQLDDYSKFEELNIPLYNINSPGGILVSGPEDLSMCVAIPTSIEVGTRHIVGRLMEFLYTRIDPADLTFTNNDILYQGRKVVGVSQQKLNDMFIFWGHISLVDRSELIAQLDITRSEKMPGSIGHIFTKEELLTDILSWFELAWEE